MSFTRNQSGGEIPHQAVGTGQIAQLDEIERLVFHMRAVARMVSNEWACGFARSILRHSKRPGWRPSAKQLACMRQLVVDLFAHGADADGDELELIER